MEDKIIGLLKDSRSEAIQDPAKSRELSLVITKIEEAIQWRESDLKVKNPT